MTMLIIVLYSVEPTSKCIPVVLFVIGSVDIQMKATEQYFPMAPCIMLYKVV